MPNTPPNRSGVQATPAVTLTAPAAHSQPTPAFDWRALVAQSQPGDTTANQRAQASRLRLATAELTTWTNQFGLLPAFVRPSAMFAVVCTPPDAPDDQTRSLARLILWYYSFDTTLDSQPLERMGDPAWVDATIRASVAPLLPDVRPAIAHGLGWGGVAPTAIETVPPIIGRLSAALADWRETTFAPWERMAPHLLVRQFWRQTLAEQLVVAATAMRQELAWTSAWRASRFMAPHASGATSAHVAARGALVAPTTTDAALLTAAPTVAAYLRVANRTTGAHPTFALACRGMGCAPTAWAQRRPLLNAAARVIRLANDASSAEADFADENITAVTSALLHLPAASTSPIPTATEVVGATYVSRQPERALRQARAQIARRLDASSDAFARRLATQPDGPDADYLRYTVAWALAHYAQP